MLLGTKKKPANQKRRLLLETLENRQLMTADFGGNTFATATNLGELQPRGQLTDFVGAADPNDFYRFDLSSPANLRLSLTGLSADADLELLSSSGQVLQRSTAGGNSSESINATLAAGAYFVRVYRYSGDTNYLVTLRAETAGPADGAGNSISQGRDLGTLNGTVVVSDFVGQADQADYYRFRVDRRTDFHLRMDGLSADADVRLLTANGQILAGSNLGGLNAEAVDRVLEAGDYAVLVYPYGSANTNYRLSLDAPAVQNGFDLRTATPIADYDGHVGADYPVAAGTPVFSPVSGRVIDVRPVDGYGTMAVAIEVTLPENRSFASELSGTNVTTNRVTMVFGHLRPSANLIDNPSASVRFQQGRGELTYGIGSQIVAGQLLGYGETHGYEGASTGSHVHVSGSNANNAPANIWQGRGLAANDPLRARFIRPELRPVLANELRMALRGA